MKLLMDVTNIAPGGGLIVVSNYLRAWAELKTPMKLVVLTSRPEVHETLKEIRTDAEFIAFCPGQSDKKVYLNTQLKLGKIVNSLKPNAVFVTNRMIPRCRYPQLVHQQNLWRFDTDNLLQSAMFGLTRFLRDKDSRLALQKAQVCTFISDYIRHAGEKYAPEHTNRFFTVYNGLSSTLLERSKHLQNKWNGRPVVAGILDTGMQKDYPTMLRTFAELVRRRPEVEWKFRIAFPKLHQETYDLARELGINEKIEWLGYLSEDQLSELFQTSMCFVYTSFFEGFGIPPLESMISGCPAVVCNSTAIPEIVGDGAIKVEPHRYDQFVEAVLSIFDNPQLRDDLVTKGIEQAKKFTWHNSAAKMYELLQRIAK